MDVHVLRDGRIVPAEGGEAFAEVLDGNPLEPGWSLSHVGPGRIVMWSGWLGSDDGPAGPATWGRGGHEAFERLCDRITVDPRPNRVLFRPQARHVLSDAPSCADFLRRRAGDALGLLLDPASMLAQSMLAHGAEHVERILGALASVRGVDAVLIANAEPAEDQGVRSVALNRGVLDPMALGAMVRRLVPADVPLVVLAGDLEAQRAIIGLGLQS